MAYLYKRGNKWWMGWDVGHQRFRKSTGCSRKADALKKLDQVRALESGHKANIIEDVYYSLSGRTVVDRPLKSAVEQWTKDLALTTADATCVRYTQIMNEFLEHVGASDTRPTLRAIDTTTITGFLDSRELSSRSLEIRHATMSVFFSYVVDPPRRWLAESPVGKLKLHRKKKTDVVKKQPFTLDQVKAIHEAAEGDWKDLVVFAFYTGMSMGDSATIEWAHIDLKGARIAIERIKTGTGANMPIAAPLLKVLKRRKKKGQFVFPDFADDYARTEARTLGGQFKRILERAGIIEKKSRKDRANGRTGKRTVNPFSFHSFRHTLTSNLRVSGAVSTVSKAITGHKSDDIHDGYTHVPEAEMKKAMAKLPTIDV